MVNSGVVAQAERKSVAQSKATLFNSVPYSSELPPMSLDISSVLFVVFVIGIASGCVGAFLGVTIAARVAKEAQGEHYAQHHNTQFTKIN